jgi:zinc D-Ala-D-Ala dipeptidase
MKSHYLSLLIVGGLLVCCSRGADSCGSCKKEKIQFLDSLQSMDTFPVEDTSFLRLIQAANLVDVQSLHKDIKVELKYAGEDNFMKMKLYDHLTKAYLQRDVAERLSKCQDYLSTLDPDLYLLVFDAVRPLSTQQKMWDALDSIPVSLRVKFVSNPANGSLHNFGAAVDLTLCSSAGHALDMGAGYDDMRHIAYPRMEALFLATGELSQQQVDNRKLLRKVMSVGGFTNISTEWWHFNACSRTEAKEKYRLLPHE